MCVQSSLKLSHVHLLHEHSKGRDATKPEHMKSLLKNYWWGKGQVK